MSGAPFLVGALASATVALLTTAPGADAERERFLLEGTIVDTKQPPGGRSRSVRATLRLDGVEHDAMVHTIDEWRASYRLEDTTEIDFRDSYRNNVAAYRLDRLLRLGMVPVTVPRSYRGRAASFMWWVEDRQMSELERVRDGVRPPEPGAWTRQMVTVRIFDQLIYNTDRHTNNLLIDGGWRLWMIDHTRSFKVFHELRDPEQLGQRCDRGMLEAMRGLDEATLRETMEGLLNPDQIRGLLGRRDAIVAHFDELIARRGEVGEVVVLFDLPPRNPNETP
jgi:hypothetical protein